MAVKCFLFDSATIDTSSSTSFFLNGTYTGVCFGYDSFVIFVLIWDVSGKFLACCGIYENLGIGTA